MTPNLYMIIAHILTHKYVLLATFPTHDAGWIVTISHNFCSRLFKTHCILEVYFGTPQIARHCSLIAYCKPQTLGETNINMYINQGKHFGLRFLTLVTV